jgi:primase-polymerase (primpol)-like protein
MTEQLLFPEILHAIARWLVYILIPPEDGSKPTKQPFSPMTLTPANRLDDTSTFDFALDTLQNAWAYATAEAHLHGPPFAGVGFRFEYCTAAPFIFVDLDNCRDPETGEIEAWALETVERFNTYTEVSPSGKGVHILFRSTWTPAAGNRKGNTEVYWCGRWAAMTGEHLPGTPFDLIDRTEVFRAFHAELFPVPPPTPAAVASAPAVQFSDDQLLNRARAARNGAMFRELFDQPPTRPNHSEEDLRLCCILSFWTGRDAERIDRLFRQSALMREKWNRRDYRLRTIRKAIESTPEVFTPSRTHTTHTTTTTKGGSHGKQS